MFTFGRGLVLRAVDRTMEFERELEFGKVQFKYLDNYEIRTFTMGALYTQILSKKIQVVHQNGYPVRLPEQLAASAFDAQIYKLDITKRQQNLIAYRLRYVQAAVRMRATAGSRKKCAAVVAQVAAVENDVRPPSADTLMLWLKRYQNSGSNPYALSDRRPLARRSKRICETAELLMEAAIAKYFMQLRGISAKATHAKLREEIKANQKLQSSIIELPSHRTLLRRINEIDPYVRDYKRLGAGIARNNWRFSLKGDQSTRVLERVEIDHTWLDIWVLDPRTGVPIGRPWITVVLDRFSGYPLGIYVSFYGPSVASVAHAIKNSIFPKDDLLAGMPDIKAIWTAMGVAEMYVLDNGLEFHALAFQRLAWDLRADLLYNPVRQPWLKASIERTMMEVNRMLPLRGKVYAPRKNMVPQDPKKGAAILFDDLCFGLIQWAADTFPKSIHPKTLVRPIDLWEEGRLSCPLPMFPLGFERFDITAGVSAERTIDGDGAFFKYMRFNSYALQDYLRSHGEKFRTEIRFNPDDLGKIHVLLPKPKEWLAVELQRPSIEYGRGLSLIQHEIIRDEAGKKLTRLNAEEELRSAQSRLESYWGEAISRGVKVRKDSDLIRFQGLSSAKVFNNQNSDSKSRINCVPEISHISESLLTNVMPFKTFSIEEDY
jgi:putative transposase